LGDAKYRPCPLLIKYVDAGWLGRKSWKRVLHLPETKAGDRIQEKGRRKGGVKELQADFARMPCTVSCEPLCPKENEGYAPCFDVPLNAVQNPMIAIIDYQAGNLTSVQRALAFLGRDSVITHDPAQVRAAERVIFPGVGAAGKAMFDIRRSGMDQALLDAYWAGKPILGICLGTQIILERSEENDTPCIGLIKGEVRRFPENLTEGQGRTLKVPHMGWNGIKFKQDHFLFAGLIRTVSFILSTPTIPARAGLTTSWDKPITGFLLPPSFSPETSWPFSSILRKAAGRAAKSFPTSVPGRERKMLSRRIIPCLDVRNGKLTKGIKFEGNVDIGDPVEMASFYYEEGADELVFYDITASSEKRDIMIETVRRVAEKIFIPFSVGGGIRSVEDMRRVLLAGAEKVSINSAAVRDPGLIARGAEAFGSQAIVLGMDVRRVSPSPKIPSGYEMVIDGGRTPAGIDALAWAREGERLGAGEICLNSIDADGTKEGYELNLTRLIASHVHSGDRIRRSGQGGTPVPGAFPGPG
jgi:imidazole glycerol-phosphate synthase subunit HisF